MVVIVSVDLNVMLFNAKEDKVGYSGFNILDERKPLVRVKKDKVLHVQHDCMLIKSLLTSTSVKFEIADICCETTAGKADFLNMSERSYYRLQKTLD